MTAMLRVGFTGTQNGMTQLQFISVRKLLRDLGPHELHHGDCVGSDDETHAIHLALAVNKEGYRIVLHPPLNPSLRAWCQGAHEERELRQYLERNANIVTECEVLIAAPATRREIIRSGTWTTVRRARDMKRTIHIVVPDGSVYTENGT